MQTGSFQLAITLAASSNAEPEELDVLRAIVATSLSSSMSIQVTSRISSNLLRSLPRKRTSPGSSNRLHRH